MQSLIPSLKAHNSTATLVVQPTALAYPLIQRPLSSPIKPPPLDRPGLPREEPSELILCQFNDGLIQLTLMEVLARICFPLDPMKANFVAFAITSVIKLHGCLSFQKITLLRQIHTDQIPKEKIVPQLILDNEETQEQQQLSRSQSFKLDP